MHKFKTTSKKTTYNYQKHQIMARKKLTPEQIREQYTVRGAAIAAMVELVKDQWSGYKPTKKQTDQVNNYIEVIFGESLKYASPPAVKASVH